MKEVSSTNSISVAIPAKRGHAAKAF